MDEIPTPQNENTFIPEGCQLSLPGRVGLDPDSEGLDELGDELPGRGRKVTTIIKKVARVPHVGLRLLHGGDIKEY